jgi:hypothetical protein
MVLLTLGLLGAACSQGTPAVEQVTTDGVPLLLNHRPLYGTVEGQLVEAADVLLIDGEIAGGPPEAILGDPREVAIGPQGQIFVLDLQDQRIKVFDQEGNFIRMFGGRGGGPGEFRFAWKLGLWESRIGVAEGQEGRLHLFDQGGSFVERINLPTRGMYGIVPFVDDTFLLAHSYRDGDPREDYDYVVAVYRVDREGNPVAFGATTVSGDSLVVARVPTSRDDPVNRRFTNEAILHLGTDGEVLLSGAHYTFWIIGPQGRRRAFRRVSPPIPYPAWWFDHWRERYEERSQLDRMPKQESVEVVPHSMTVDERGHLWVIEYASVIAHFDSWAAFDASTLIPIDEFDSDGRWLRHVVLSFPVVVRLVSLEDAADGYLYGSLLAGPPTDSYYVVRFQMP